MPVTLSVEVKQQLVVVFLGCQLRTKHDAVNSQRVCANCVRCVSWCVGCVINSAPKSQIIKPHTHRNYLRKINETAEVLFVKSGVLRVDFYASKNKYLFSKILKKNSIAILIEGSHGFKVIKKCSLIEIKQGPFVKKLDKVRFNKTKENKIRIKK